MILDTYVPEQHSLSAALNQLRQLAIYELSCGSAIHCVLKALPHYCCSEFFDGVPPGTISPEGIRCEDVRNLSFPDSSFDLVISEDVLEHVDGPEHAFIEICRVLKKGGYHIFTIPLYGDRKTRKKCTVENGKIVHLLPPEYHHDPIRGDILVFNEFGTDLRDILQDVGFRTEFFFCDKDDEECFGIFNSVVLRSEKV